MPWSLKFVGKQESLNSICSFNLNISLVSKISEQASIFYYCVYCKDLIHFHVLLLKESKLINKYFHIVEEGSSSDHSKRICTNAKDILAGNLETERQDNKDHNKNCIRTEEDSSEASPGQRRKLMLLDRVQKYLGSKRETADLRNSLELLGSSIASERDPLICPEDMESPVNNNDVFSKGFEHNKEISFVENLNTQKTADLSEKESETSDCLKIKTVVDEKRKSQSCSNIPDFVNNYPYGGSGMRDSCGEARPRSYCDKIINKNIRNMYRDSIIDSTRSSVIDGRKGELGNN